MGVEGFHNPIGAFRRKADYNYECIDECMELFCNKYFAATGFYDWINCNLRLYLTW
ncbi:MAG: hypothetical protein WCD89_27120 [Anaerocolumna sp.]